MLPPPLQLPHRSCFSLLRSSLKRTHNFFSSALSMLHLNSCRPFTPTNITFKALSMLFHSSEFKEWMKENKNLWDRRRQISK